MIDPDLTLNVLLFAESVICSADVPLDCAALENKNADARNATANLLMRLFIEIT